MNMDRQRGVTLRFLAEPGEVNFSGKVQGGSVMKWIDQAGYTCAAGWTGSYCVTLYVGGLRFLAPIHVGELVELRALVIRTGRTSLDIAVDVYAGDPKSTALEIHPAVNFTSGVTAESMVCVITSPCL